MPKQPGFKLYWKAIIGEPSVINSHPHAGHGYFSNEALEKMLNDMFEKGVAAGQLEHERNGIIKFGQEVRKRMKYWRDMEPVEGRVPSVPIWDMDNLLEQYNIPEEKEDGDGAEG